MISLLRWAARRSLGFVHAIGWVLGWLTYALSPSYRGRLQANAAQAGVAIADQRRAVGQAGRMAAELPWLWLAPESRRISDWVSWRGAEVMEAALAQGRGLILMTPHLGSFEVCARAYAERWGQQAPMTALYRPARQAWLRELEESARARPGLHTAPATLAGVRQMIRALRRGETVGLLPDQVPPLGMGIWAPFYGRDAYTMTLASRLLEQTGSSLLLMWAERMDAGRGWTLHVQEAQQVAALGQSPAAASRAGLPPTPGEINGLMETLIRRAPDQYLWGYHRYKQPRQSGPSGESS